MSFRSGEEQPPPAFLYRSRSGMMADMPLPPPPPPPGSQLMFSSSGHSGQYQFELPPPPPQPVAGGEHASNYQNIYPRHVPHLQDTWKRGSRFGDV